MIWGDAGLKELVPLNVMGDGMTRVAHKDGVSARLSETLGLLAHFSRLAGARFCRKRHPGVFEKLIPAEGRPKSPFVERGQESRSFRFSVSKFGIA